MLRGKLQSELFYCNHLGVSDKDEQDMKTRLIATKHMVFRDLRKNWKKNCIKG